MFVMCVWVMFIVVEEMCDCEFENTRVLEDKRFVVDVNMVEVLV